MPIYKMDGKKDGLQKYRVRINYVDGEGRSRQIDRVAYGKEAAKELEMQLSNTVKEDFAKKITVQQLYDEYISVKQHEIRESSLDTAKRKITQYVLPFLKNYKLTALTPAVLEGWKRQISECPNGRKKGEKLSIKMKKNIYGEFRAMLNYAVKLEYINKNPLVSVGNFKNPYGEKKEIDFYTAEEFQKFIKSARQNAINISKSTASIYEWNFYVFFSIAFYTGMRKGEIYALRWNDIEKNVIHVTRSITQKLKGGDRETPPKNKSSIRDITIPTPLKKILDEHRRRYKKISGFDEKWRICGGEICVRSTSVDNHNKRYDELAGIKKISLHGFRHSHASVLANNGINIQEIARRLGHSNVEITWNTYSHLYPREEERAVRVLNKIV